MLGSEREDADLVKNDQVVASRASKLPDMADPDIPERMGLIRRALDSGHRSAALLATRRTSRY